MRNSECYLNTLVCIFQLFVLVDNFFQQTKRKYSSDNQLENLMFIGPCIIAKTEEWKTN